MEIIGVVTLAILMMLCTVAGIGGGGITIPILQVFFVFEFKEATAVSGISILICSMARYIYNFKQMHPEKQAVAIDYGLAIIMLPTVMMGSFIGVIMNAAMPDLVLQVCLTLLLGFLTVQSLMKAREILKKENQKAKEQRAAKKEALKAKRMLGEDANEDGDHQRGIDIRQNVTGESESDNEGFSSEDESFKNSSFSLDKKVAMNNTENSNTFLTSSEVLTTVVDKKIDDNGNPYELATDAEKARLEKLLNREATHWQFDKHAVCFLLLVSNVLVSLMRGSKRSGSIIGI